MFTKAINKLKQHKIVVAVIAIILPILMELVLYRKIEISLNGLIRIIAIYGVYILIGIYYLLKHYENFVKKTVNFIIDKRYIIAGIVLVVVVLLKINCSSLSVWRYFTNELDTRNVLIGKEREIRSDEWLVQTPIIFGQMQGEDAFEMYNSNIGQGNINLLMMTAPVKDIITIAKPAVWGFMFLGQEHGLSFYCIFKILALLLVSIEIVLKFTNRDKLLGLVGGIILALAPAMMWWFSTSIVDGYIYGMIAVILFGYYMNNLDWHIAKKIATAIGLIISISAFAFVLYPAFQVPFAFFMAIIMLTDLIPNIKKLKAPDYILIGISIIGIIGLVARFALLCWNDIVTMMNTVYPGQRISTGGDMSIESFISYFSNMFYPYCEEGIANRCEQSTYIYPFVALIILIINYFKNINKKENKSVNIIALIIFYIFLLLWEFVGLGTVVAKITLLSMSPTLRLHIITGIVGTLIMLALLKKNEDEKIFSTNISVIISIIVVGISFLLIRGTGYKTYFSSTKLIIWSIALFAMTYTSITCNKKAWSYVMCIIAIVAGCAVNPICIGISPISETKISENIKIIKNEDENAIWVGNSNMTSQYLVANGIKTLNGVHMYPSFEWINKVDSNGIYNEVYNRYAHISIELGNESSFKLLTPDSYKVVLSLNDIKNLNIRYFYTTEECTEQTKRQFNLIDKYIDNDKHQYIYMIKE